MVFQLAKVPTLLSVEEVLGLPYSPVYQDAYEVSIRDYQFFLFVPQTYYSVKRLPMNEFRHIHNIGVYTLRLHTLYMDVLLCANSVEDLMALLHAPGLIVKR